MVFPVVKSSFKEQETSKPKEIVVEPIPSHSVPLKEVAAKATAEALALELRETKVIQREREPVAVIEDGTSRPPLYLDHDGYTYSPDASFFNVSPPSDEQVSECLRSDRTRLDENAFRVEIVGD
jgi:hypothetical protein